MAITDYTIVQTISVDFQVAASFGVPPRVHAKQYDHGMRTVLVQLWDRGKPYRVPDGYTVRIGVKKPDGHHVLNDCEHIPGASGEPDRACVVVTEQMATSAGDVHGEIQVSGAGGVLRSADIVLCILPAAVGDDTITSADEYKSIDTILAEVRTLKTQADASAIAAAGSAAEAQQVVDDAKMEGALAVNVNVGTVTTLNAGEQATVTNVSTEPGQAVLDFGIPRGSDGRMTEADKAKLDSMDILTADVDEAGAATIKKDGVVISPITVVANVVGAATAESVAAKADVSALAAKADAATHNLKTYTSLAQLGLTGPVTMEQVCAALPSGSIYWAGNYRGDGITDVPARYSYVAIYGASSATHCECHEYGVPQYWVATYYSNTAPKFSGWRRMALETIVPPGTIVPSAAASVPAGYLSCEGQAVSRTTYADLFAAIGTAYGAGDGSTTYGLPNLGYKYPRGGTASGRGAIGGKGVINLTVAQLPAHTMPMREAIMWPEPSSAPAHSTGTGWGAGWATAAGPWVGGITATNSIGSGSNVDTTDPYQYVRYYIKY